MMKKHIGKLKESGTSVAVIFMKLPDEPNNCLVVDLDSLNDQMRTELMNVIQSEEGQNSRSIHDLLYRRMFQGGTSILEALHQDRNIMKRRTDEVIMTPNTENSIPLDKLNEAMERVENNTENLSDEEIQQNKNEYKRRIEEKEVSEREQIGKNLMMEAEDLEAQAQMMVATAKQKREQAKDYFPEPQAPAPAPAPVKKQKKVKANENENTNTNSGSTSNE